MKKNESSIISKALTNYFNSMTELQELGVLINKKDFTCQIGEWLVETIYEGQRASNGIQKGWDIKVGDRHIQVKTHSKAQTNKAGFSTVVIDSSERIDELIIIVFTYNYKLKAFYKIPWKDALQYISLRGIKAPRSEIKWSSIRDYKINIEELPRQDIISLFK